jgi:hypothetical protein
MNERDRSRSGPKDQGPTEPDFAAQMARAEFGRHYVDTARVEQTLADGAIASRPRDLGPRRRRR